MKRIFLLFFLAIITLSGVYYGISRLFQVRRLVCTTQFGSCPDSIFKLVQPFLGTSLLPPFSSSAINHKLAVHRQIKSFTLSRQLPDRLVIQLLLRSPLGVVYLSESSATGSVVDSEGVPLGSFAATNLPVLYYSDYQSSQQLDQLGVTSLSIIQQVSTLSRISVSGILKRTTLEISIPNGPKVIIDASKSDSDWYSPLQLILDRSKISFKSPKTIDLRYTNPVLTY